MKLLCVETSTKNFSLAVSDSGKVIASHDVFLENPLSDSIVSSINAILKKAKIKLSSIDGFAVGLGPGSFTSLRVGLSTIKGFAFAEEKPVVGISSLDILAMNVKEQDRPIGVIVDARRGMVYACVYEWKKNLLAKKSDYQLVEIKNLVKKIPSQTILVGDGIQLYKNELKAKIKGAEFYPEKLQYPQAKHMVSLALKRFEDQKIDDVNKLVPIYLYPEDCQVTKK